MESSSSNGSLLQQIHQVDTRAFYWVLQRKLFPQLAVISRYISKTADGYLYPVLGLALFFSGITSGTDAALVLLLAFAIERPLYFLLKNCFKRNRPMDILPDISSLVIPSDKFSFPSGHTSAAFVVATIIASLIPATTPFVFLWATSVAWSRVCLGVHFPTDTLFGALLGSLCAIVSLSLIA